MKIIDKAIDEIKPYENNPRNNDEAVDKVAASIKYFGFKVPIIIDSDNVIVAGHTRYKAALKIGCESVPCIVADDLSQEQIKAFRLVDNKTAEYSTWDFEKLEKELEEISLDITEFEFIESESYIDDLMSDEEFQSTHNTETFTRTLVFPNEYKETINGLDREELANIIIKEVCE